MWQDKIAFNERIKLLNQSSAVQKILARERCGNDQERLNEKLKAIKARNEQNKYAYTQRSVLDGIHVKTLICHTRSNFSRCMCVTASNIIVGSRYGEIKIFDLKTGIYRQTLSSGFGMTALSAVGNKVILGFFNGTVGIFDLNTGKCLDTLYGHTSWLSSITILGNKIVTCSLDGTAKIWYSDKGKYKCLHTLNGHTAAISDNRIITGLVDGTAKVWNAETGQCLHTLVDHRLCVTSVAIFGNKVITGSSDFTAKVWNAETGQCLHTLIGHRGEINSVAVVGNKIVTGSSDHTAKVWDMETGKCLHTLVGHEGAVIVVTAAGNDIVTGSSMVEGDGTVRVWHDMTVFERARVFAAIRCTARDGNNSILKEFDRPVVDQIGQYILQDTFS